MEFGNKKGGIGIAIILSIFIFIVGLSVMNLIIPEVTTFRTDMSCSDAANISDGSKLTCLIGDATVPYFILLVFSVAGGFLVEKLAL